jgi:AsmA-like C-terminal region
VLRPAGQAARELGWWLHRICEIALTLIVVAVAATAVLAWRLSEGPLDLGFLRHRAEKIVNKVTAPARVSIGDLSIAWRGFHTGLNQPLVFRIENLGLESASGSATAVIPRAEVTLSIRGLLSGHVLPRRITLTRLSIGLERQPDGTYGLNMGEGAEPGRPSPLVGLLAALAEPSGSDLQSAAGPFSQLSEIAIRDARFTLTAGQATSPWSARRVDMDLMRHLGGGVDGAGSFALDLSGQRAGMDVRFSIPPGASTAHAVFHMSPVSPAALAEPVGQLSAALAPSVPWLRALQAPVTLEGEADVGADLIPTHGRLGATLGAGRFQTAEGAVPFSAAALRLTGTPERVTVEDAWVALQAGPDTPTTMLRAKGTVSDQNGAVRAAMHLTLDSLAFADLPAIWPPDIAHHLRRWLGRQVSGGVAHDGAVDLVVELPAGGRPVVTEAGGGIDGDDLVVAWMPGVSPVEQGHAHLTLTGPDDLVIDVRSARQRTRAGEPIPLRNGRVAITGLAHKDQVATVNIDASGPIASGIEVLKEPALKLLDAHPMTLTAPAGDARLHIMAIVPLETWLELNMITFHATGDLARAHLGGVVNGQDLDDGAVLVDADVNRLTLKGTARLGGIPVKLDGLMDFRDGPPVQVVRRFVVSGKASAEALAKAGLDSGGAVSGDIDLSAILSDYRNGDGDLAIRADLTAAALAIPPIGWKKPAGEPAKAAARVLLTHDDPTALDRLTVDGAGLQVRGDIGFTAGRPSVIRLDRALLGQSDMAGSIRLPPKGSPAEPIMIALSGPSIDLSSKLLEKPAPNQTGPAWAFQGRFDRVILAHEEAATGVSFTALHDGTIFRSMAAAGTIGGKPYSIRISPGPTGRHLSVNIPAAGLMLRGLDIVTGIQGGAMTIEGDFDDKSPAHPLNGTLDMTDFRVTRAPVLGKLLQAVTLYGLVDALGGPGLAFSHLIAPFRVTDDAVELHDARGFSPSLGLTGKGTIDRVAQRLDLEGTVVPAYVLNSLLGKLPLIGGLFSAETGGGLLAMNYAIRGPQNDPTVLANPFSALTPGILRGMFGVFPKLPLDQPPPGGKGPPQ